MANKYYQNPQERLPKETYEIYQNLSEEEKDKRQKKTRERYQNFAAEETENGHHYNLECKQKLLECIT